MILPLLLAISAAGIVVAFPVNEFSTDSFLQNHGRRQRG